MPLYSDQESLRRMLNRLDRSVARVSSRNAQPFAKLRHRLVMPRIDLPVLPPRDSRKHGPGLDSNRMGGLARIVRRFPAMPTGIVKVLNKRSTQMNIQHLHAPANRQNGYIVGDSVAKKVRLGHIAFVVRRVRLPVRRLVVTEGVHVGST